MTELIDLLKEVAQTASHAVQVLQAGGSQKQVMEILEKLPLRRNSSTGMQPPPAARRHVYREPSLPPTPRKTNRSPYLGNSVGQSAKRKPLAEINKVDAASVQKPLKLAACRPAALSMRAPGTPTSKPPPRLPLQDHSSRSQHLRHVDSVNRLDLLKRKCCHVRVSKSTHCLMPSMLMM
jgi:hypothetical protein